MKDFDDKALNIGDTVAFMGNKIINSRASQSLLQKGIIESFTEKMVVIKCGEDVVRRKPQHIALIQN